MLIVKTTIKCLNCKLWYRISSFEHKKNIKCPRCNSNKFESVYKNFNKKTKKQKNHILNKVIELQKEDMKKSAKNLLKGIGG